MKKIIIIGIALLMIANTYGQINMNDSTVQVIGYWNKNEKQSFLVTNERYKVTGTDTSSREAYKYIVDVHIVDSTADSYTIDWFYHDYEFTTNNELVKKLSAISEEMTITIVTDGFGMFKEVKNWEEIRDYISKMTQKLSEQTTNIPNFKDIVKQIVDRYQSKESIEAAAIMEIQQFYTFHGGKYKLDEEISGTIKTPNLLGGEPFDTEVVIWLQEIDTAANTAMLNIKQEVNSEQLTKATFDYLTKMSESLKVPGPKRDEFRNLVNETWTTSIIHTSGWVIYSLETKTVSNEGATSYTENTIELQ